MKKYKSIILLFGCLCMASCSDFLDTESLSEQTGEVIYENEGMTRSAIMGILNCVIVMCTDKKCLSIGKVSLI